MNVIVPQNRRGIIILCAFVTKFEQLPTSKKPDRKKKEGTPTIPKRLKR